MIILFAPMNNATVMRKGWRERSCNKSVIHIVHELCSNYICTHIRIIQHFRILHIIYMEYSKMLYDSYVCANVITTQFMYYMYDTFVTRTFSPPFSHNRCIIHWCK